MNYAETVNESINYELLEKKERAKANLKWFLIPGIVGTILASLIAFGNGGAPSLGILEAIIVIPIVGVMMIYGVGSMVFGIHLVVQKLGIAILFFTLGGLLLVGAIIGLLVTPFIIARDIYYLAKKY